MLIADNFNPAIHKRHEGPFTHYIRRELREPNLFVFRHEETGNWIVAAWEPWKRERVFREITCIGRNLSDANRELVHWLKYVWRGPPCDFRKRLREKETADARREADQEEEYNDALRFLAKRQRMDDHPYFEEP